MNKPEYMTVHLKFFPDNIIQSYNPHALSDSKGYIFKKINKDMYGLNQAVIVVCQQISIRLNATGYKQIIWSTGT